jgi:hypothetical protein
MEQTNRFTVTRHRHSRYWAVHDPAGDLVCVCVYKRGAIEVARRLAVAPASGAYYLSETPPENSREPVRERPDASRGSE